MKRFILDKQKFTATIYDEDIEEETSALTREEMESLLESKKSFRVFDFRTQRECTATFKVKRRK